MNFKVIEFIFTNRLWWRAVARTSKRCYLTMIFNLLKYKVHLADFVLI